MERHFLGILTHAMFNRVVSLIEKVDDQSGSRPFDSNGHGKLWRHGHADYIHRCISEWFYGIDQLQCSEQHKPCSAIYLLSLAGHAGEWRYGDNCFDAVCLSVERQGWQRHDAAGNSTGRATSRGEGGCRRSCCSGGLAVHAAAAQAAAPDSPIDRLQCSPDDGTLRLR